MIQITINGEPKSIASGMTVSDLLLELEMNSRAIAVEINRQIQPRHTHQETQINPGDVLEIVTLVGGG